MNEAVMREKLLEISETINALEDLNRTPNSTEGLYAPQCSTDMECVVDELRMKIKYLMFDVEASRRENKYLRQMLEMRPPQPRGDRGDDSDPNSGWR